MPSQDRSNPTPSLVKRQFELDVKSDECPNSLLSIETGHRELVELQFQHESSGIQLFHSDPEQRPAWSLDFYELISTAENKIHAKHEESIARS